MPLGLIVGPALQAFQTGDLFALLADNLFQGSDFAQQFNQQSLKLCTAQPGKGGWRRHIPQRIPGAESAQEKNAAMPVVVPLLRLRGRATPLYRTTHRWP